MNSRLRRAVMVLSAAALTLAGTTVLSPPASAAGNTIFVAPGGGDVANCGGPDFKCQTIQYALDHRAVAGDTVAVMAGTYPESVSITSAITLQGTGASIDGSVTVGDAGGPVTVDGFSISSATAPALVSVIDSVPTDTVTVSDNTFSGATAATQVGIDVNANTAATLTENTFEFGDQGGAAISLTANSPNTLNATLGGNAGTVEAPTRTIDEAGDGTINITPTAAPNTIAPTGASLSVPLPTNVFTGATFSQFTGSANSGTDLPHARYDLRITGTSGISHDELTLLYLVGSDWTPVPLSGAATAGDAITGEFGPSDGFGFPAGENDTDFRLSASADAPNGALSVTVALDEVAQPSGTPSLNTVATDTRSVDIVTDSPPTAQPQSVSTHFNKAVTISLTSTDADGDARSYAIATQPAHGTLGAINGSTVSYTPNANYVGSDSFTFTAADQYFTSAAATVNVSVAANQVPVALPQSATIPFDGHKDFTLSSTDGDGDTRSYAIATQPAHGTLSPLTGSSVTYTADPGYSGADSFTFTAADQYDTSAPATVSITVGANQTPVATAQSATIAFNGHKTLVLSSTDAEGDSRTYAIAAQPAHGTLSLLTGSSVTYTADPGYSGPDSFTFTAADQFSTSNPATVSITVSPNTPPVASNKQYRATAGSTVSITLSATDANHDALTFSHGNPTKGSISGSGARLVYHAPTSSVGSSHFTYRATDAYGASATATITITIAKAAAKISSVTFSPAHPTSAQVPKVVVRLTSAGTVTGGTVTVRFGKYTRIAKVSGGKATVTLIRMSGGAHRLTVSFGGTSTTTATAAKAYSLVVSKVHSSMSVSISPKQITTASKGKATVRVSAPGATINGREVTIKEGSRVIGSGKLSRGVATIALPQLALGQHNWVVSFAGSTTATAVTKTVIVRVALG